MWQHALALPGTMDMDKVAVETNIISYNTTIRAPRLSGGILCKTWSTPNTISYSAAIQCRMCRTSLALSRTAVCRWPGEA